MVKIEEIIEKIKKKEQDEFSTIYEEMDQDYDLWNVKPRIFDAHKMAINITGNDPRSLFDKVQAYLIGSKLQIKVLPPENHPAPEAKEVANAEERLYHFAIEQADIRLRGILEANLLNSLSWHSLARGMAAARVLIYPDNKGNIMWDILPLDPRYLTFGIGRDGLSWTAYKTFRDPISLKEDYNVDLHGEANRGVEVIDYWDKEANVILTSQGQLLEKVLEHKLEEVPVIIRPVAMSPRLVDPTGNRRMSWGQSIFAPNRLTYRQVDLLRSVLATHAHMLAKSPTVFQSDVGVAPYTLPENEVPYYAGAVMNLPAGVRAVRLPIPDIPHSLETAIGLGRGDIQRATYSDIGYGIDQPPHSGTALTMLRAEMDKVIGPRKQALTDVYTDICLMIKRQIVKQGLTVPIKTVYQDKYAIYDMVPSQLDNDFHVSVDFTIEHPWEELERYQLFQMATQNGAMSRESGMNNILKIDDVKAELEKMTLEEVEAMSAELKLWKAMKIYERTGQEKELNIVASQLQQVLQQKAAQTEQIMGGGQAPAPRNQEVK